MSTFVVKTSLVVLAGLLEVALPSTTSTKAIMVCQGQLFMKTDKDSLDYLCRSSDSIRLAVEGTGRCYR